MLNLKTEMYVNFLKVSIHMLLNGLKMNTDSMLTENLHGQIRQAKSVLIPDI